MMITTPMTQRMTKISFPVIGPNCLYKSSAFFFNPSIRGFSGLKKIIKINQIRKTMTQLMGNR